MENNKKVNVQLNVRLGQAGQMIAQTLIAKHEWTGVEEKIMKEICSRWVANLFQLEFDLKLKFFENDGTFVLSTYGKNMIIEQFMAAFKIELKDYRKAYTNTKEFLADLNVDLKDYPMEKNKNRNDTVQHYMIYAIMRILKKFVEKPNLLHFYFTEEAKDEGTETQSQHWDYLFVKMSFRIYFKIKATDGGIDNVIAHWIDNNYKDVLDWHLKSGMVKELANEVYQILWNEKDGIIHIWFARRYYSHKGPRHDDPNQEEDEKTSRRRYGSKKKHGPSKYVPWEESGDDDELKNDTILKF